MKLTTTVALILLASATSSPLAFGNTRDCDAENNYPLITKTELKSVAAKKSATIIDVNSDASFAKNHVPGAVHFASHTSDFATILPKDKGTLVVAYCGGVQCNTWKKAASEACKLGYTNVRHFKEGITGWVKND